MAAVAHYAMHHSLYEEELDDVDAAFRFLAYGLDAGSLWPVKVVDGEEKQLYPQ